jgi:hypothetical protein
MEQVTLAQRVIGMTAINLRTNLVSQPDSLARDKDSESYSNIEVGLFWFLDILNLPFVYICLFFIVVFYGSYPLNRNRFDSQSRILGQTHSRGADVLATG